LNHQHVPEVLQSGDQARRGSVACLWFLGTSGNLPAWNVSKYVIGKDGRIVAFVPSKVTPESSELRTAIDRPLAAK
jgi:glutathione peroxidase-family protein